MANALPPLILPPNSFVGNNSSADAQAAAVPLATLAGLLQLSNFPYSDAGGTADAITGTYASVTTLYTGLTLSVGIATINATTTPTFAPTINGVLQTAHTIKRYVGNARVALAIGDLEGIAFLTYDLTNTCWILLNPSEGGKTTIASATTPDIFNVAGPTIDYTGTATCTGFVAAPKAGMTRRLICAGACLFTAGANLLIEGIPSGTTITLAANAIVDVTAITTTQFKMTYSLSGSYTVTATGFTTTITGTAVYSIKNGVVNLQLPTLQGTSNANTLNLTGNPSCVTTVGGGSFLPISAEDNGVWGAYLVSVQSTTMAIFNLTGQSTIFTTSGTKGIRACNVCFQHSN